jgi:hypothetical protein
VDLNQDGINDILSGSYSRTDGKMAGLFQILWGTSEGGFQQAKVLNGSDGKPLIIPSDDRKYLTETICTRPTAVDWDADGDLDLVVGNFSGSFYLFKGEGNGKFDPQPKLIKSDDNKPLKIQGAHSDPVVIDWDGDGDLDLLSGSSQGGVQWAENQGSKGQKRPTFKGFEPLIVFDTVARRGTFLSEDDLTGPTSDTRIWVDDVNGDGKLDILVGDSVALSSPAKGLSEKEARARMAEWQKEVDELMIVLRDRKASAKDRQDASKRYNDLYRQKSKYVRQEMTGFVWLYVQK